MKARKQRGDSFWPLLLDLLSARALVWVASAGKDGADLTPEAHAFFCDRYHRLAEYHRARGRPEKARRIQAKAEAHYRAGGSDGPPFAAAMAMPRPRQFIRTEAVSGDRLGGPDDAA